MQDDVSRLVQRAALWFASRLPPTEQAESFSVYVSGPRYNPEEQVAFTFHTFACLYPDRDLYVAMDTSGNTKPAAWRVTGPQIREVVGGFTPPHEKVVMQRELAAMRLPGSTALLRWTTAIAVGVTYELPVAVMAFGHNANNELLVYQRSLLLAPLRKIETAFKEAAPHINLN